MEDGDIIDEEGISGRPGAKSDVAFFPTVSITAGRLGLREWVGICSPCLPQSQQETNMDGSTVCGKDKLTAEVSCVLLVYVSVC